MTYIGANNEKQRPYMIHRALLGSIERFMGVLIEHYAGAMPFWLAPLQVKILPISDKFIDHARDVEKRMRAAGIRAEVDDRNEKIGHKIRDAELKKTPYMAIVGEKEAASGAVSVRRHGKGDQGPMQQKDFIELLLRQDTPGASL
jgi:threonyl-tRNA synthetase